MAQGNIEDWLSQLLARVQKTVNITVQAAAVDCETMKIDEFTHKYPAQVSLIGIQFQWTMDCEDALYRSKLLRDELQRLSERREGCAPSPHGDRTFIHRRVQVGRGQTQ